MRDGRTIPLGVFCRKSLAEHLDADNVIAITKAGFTWFEETFDCDYPFPKYDQLFVPEFNAGAMENAARSPSPRSTCSARGCPRP